MDHIHIEGVAVSGYGKGGRFLSHGHYRKYIKDLSWLDPYPGTFNIKCGCTPELDESSAMVIPARGNLGAVLCYPAVLHLKDGSITVSGLVVRPERSTHEPDILEFVTDHCIRSTYGVKDGEKVILYILTNGDKLQKEKHTHDGK